MAWYSTAINAILRRGLFISGTVRVGYTEKDHNITLNRMIFTNRSTIGVMLIDSIMQCYTLELSARKQDGVKNCIVPGKYEVKMQWSTRFKMNTPHLQNVPGRTFIEIHPGNKPSDTDGCILLGKTKDTDWVGSSRAAYNELIPKIEKKLTAGKLYINIVGNV